MLRKLGKVNMTERRSHDGMKSATRMIMCLLFSVLFLSCTKTIYQEHEVVRYDSIYVYTTSYHLDTIMQHDSIHVLEKGDTLIQTVYKYIYKVKERTDTCYISKTDTVTHIETKVEEKTKYKKDWLSIIGAIVVGAIVGIIIGKIKE